MRYKPSNLKSRSSHHKWYLRKLLKQFNDLRFWLNAPIPAQGALVVKLHRHIDKLAEVQRKRAKSKETK
jgi:hypothetical protein